MSKDGSEEFNLHEPFEKISLNDTFLSDLKPVATKKDGDCAFHAIFGIWTGSRFKCKDAQGRRNQIAHKILESKEDSRLHQLAREGIKALIMSNQAHGECMKQLLKKYQDFLREKDAIKPHAWRQFEEKLNGFPPIREYILKNNELSETSTPYDKFYSALTKKEGELYGRILSIPDLNEAFKTYNNALNADFSWKDVITFPILAEYALFFSQPRLWLLPSELEMIGIVFKKTIVFYSAPDAKPLELNPGQKEFAFVQFDGVNHYQRMEKFPQSGRENIENKKNKSTNQNKFDKNISPNQLLRLLQEIKTIAINPIGDPTRHLVSLQYLKEFYRIGQHLEKIGFFNLKEQKEVPVIDIFINAINFNGYKLREIAMRLPEHFTGQPAGVQDPLKLQSKRGSEIVSHLDNLRDFFGNSLSQVMNANTNFNLFLKAEIVSILELQAKIGELLPANFSHKHSPDRLKFKMSPTDGYEIIKNLFHMREIMQGVSFLSILEKEIFQSGTFESGIIHIILRYLIPSPLWEENFLVLMPRFDLKKCEDIKGNAVILTNENTAYFIIQGKIAMKDEKPQFVQGINRQIIPYCQSNQLVKIRTLKNRNNVIEFTIIDFLGNTVINAMDEDKLKKEILQNRIIDAIDHIVVESTSKRGYIQFDYAPWAYQYSCLVGGSTQILDTLYFFREGVDENFKMEGKEFFSGQSIFLEGETHYFLDQYKDALSYYYDAAEEGYPPAYLRLAELLQKSSLFSLPNYQHINYCLKKLGTHIYWFEACAEIGHAEQQYYLGECYFNGFGVFRNIATAVKWFQNSAEKSLPQAEFMLGLCYSQGGMGIERDEKQALSWYRKSAEHGFAKAQDYLGKLYLNGHSGVLLNLISAFDYFQKAAKQGYANSQCFLGWCYEHGKGVEINEKEARIWYKKAQEQGGQFDWNNFSRLMSNPLPQTGQNSMTFFSNSTNALSQSSASSTMRFTST